MNKPSCSFLRIFFIGISIFSLGSFSSEARQNSFNNLSCRNLKTRFSNKNSYILKSEEICLSEDKKVLLSKLCIGGRMCEALRKKEASMLDIQYDGFGNPAFKACYQWGGSPQIFEFNYHKKWTKADRCIFSDGSFVNTHFLLD